MRVRREPVSQTGALPALQLQLAECRRPPFIRFRACGLAFLDAVALLLAEEEKTGRHVRGRFLLRENKLASMLSEDADEHYLSVVEDEGSVKHFLVSSLRVQQWPPFGLPPPLIMELFLRAPGVTVRAVNKQSAPSKAGDPLL